MNITSYKDNPQAFLNDLTQVNMDQLTGNKSSELEPLLIFIKEKGIRITELETGNPPVLNEELLKKMLAYFMPADALTKGGWYDDQIKSGIKYLKETLTRAVEGDPTAKPNPIPPKTQWSLKEFMSVAHFGLTGDRVDDDIIGVMVENMTIHANKRDKTKREVNRLSAELRIYSIIQTEIGRVQGNGVGVHTGRKPGHTVNLLDYKFYGYATHEDFVKKDANGNYNAVYQLLREIALDSKVNENTKDNPAVAQYEADELGITKEQYLSKLRDEIADVKADRPSFLSARDFLMSSKKDTGPMLDISHYYENKDNKVSNFATSVNDKARPLNDKVSHATTELNDISSRYNSVIEAINKFIQKYDSIMQQILQSI